MPHSSDQFYFLSLVLLVVFMSTLCRWKKPQQKHFCWAEVELEERRVVVSQISVSHTRTHPMSPLSTWRKKRA